MEYCVQNSFYITEGMQNRHKFNVQTTVNSTAAVFSECIAVNLDAAHSE